MKSKQNLDILGWLDKNRFDVLLPFTYFVLHSLESKNPFWTKVSICWMFGEFFSAFGFSAWFRHSGRNHLAFVQMFYNLSPLLSASTAFEASENLKSSQLIGTARLFVPVCVCFWGGGEVRCAEHWASKEPACLGINISLCFVVGSIYNPCPVPILIQQVKT